MNYNVLMYQCLHREMFLVVQVSVVAILYGEHMPSLPSCDLSHSAGVLFVSSAVCVSTKQKISL